MHRKRAARSLGRAPPPADALSAMLRPRALSAICCRSGKRFGSRHAVSMVAFQIALFVASARSAVGPSENRVPPGSLTRGAVPSPMAAVAAAPNPTKGGRRRRCPTTPPPGPRPANEAWADEDTTPEARADPAESRPKEDAATWPDKAPIEARPSEGDAPTRPNEYAATRPNEAPPETWSGEATSEATPDEASPAATLGRDGVRSQGCQ